MSTSDMHLLKSEEMAWIDAVLSHKTADAFSVADVIEFARNNICSGKFKLMGVGVAYREHLQPSVSIKFSPYPNWQCFDDCYECAVDYGVARVGGDLHVAMYEYHKIQSGYCNHEEEIQTFHALEKGRLEFLNRVNYLHEYYRSLIE